MRSTRWGASAAVIGLAVTLGAGVVACGAGGDAGEDAADRLASSDTGGATGTTQDPNCDGRGWTDAEPAAAVEVDMDEYTLTATPAEVPAGTIEITADNGGSLFHELVVVRWDGDAGALPQNDAGGADQMQFRDAEVGRIFDFVAGVSCTARFDLEPGTYALICNLVDDGFNPHYSQGMHTTLTVT